MPRKKNQSHNVPNVRKDSTENTSQNTDVELKWRDTTLKDLQSMFSGSVDPEVVLLVLSESNYNGKYVDKDFTREQLKNTGPLWSSIKLISRRNKQHNMYSIVQKIPILPQLNELKILGHVQNTWSLHLHVSEAFEE